MSDRGENSAEVTLTRSELDHLTAELDLARQRVKALREGLALAPLPLLEVVLRENGKP